MDINNGGRFHLKKNIGRKGGNKKKTKKEENKNLLSEEGAKWKEHKDVTTGKSYYVDQETNRSTWTDHSKDEGGNENAL